MTQERMEAAIQAAVEARAQKAEAKVAELEGVVQSHEIVLSQTAERAQKAEAEVKIANEYRAMWYSTARGQEARAQKAEDEVKRLRALCAEAVRAAPLFDAPPEWREIVGGLAAAAKVAK